MVIIPDDAPGNIAQLKEIMSDVEHSCVEIEIAIDVLQFLDQHIIEEPRLGHIYPMLHDMISKETNALFSLVTRRMPVDETTGT